MRIIIMLIMCLTMVLHAAYVRPHGSDIANECKIGSLVILIVLCLINIAVAFSHESMTHLTGYLALLPEIFAWIEAILVEIIPVFILAVLIISIGLRLTVVLCKMIFQGAHLICSMLYNNIK